ncbi:MAG: PrsW family glutamic-type intramembrane protease [Fibrobacter sp.]|nr:PrsW family glutamic-type intramembrane protease [Fibrobacter sp.]
MKLLALALLPAIVLLVYIYKKDTVEKEPLSLLMKCLGIGILTIIPILGCELLLKLFLVKLPGLTKGSIIEALISGYFIAALCEEGFKFLALKKVTWNNQNFNYFFDGIVYAVFVSLGFAAIENIEYVIFNGGVSTAILRMFTAVPGHTCYGVVMGYFYGAAKNAEVEGRIDDCKKMLNRAVFIPLLLHGAYDALIMTKAEVVGTSVNKLCFAIWTMFVIAMFKRCFSMVDLASKYDQEFIKND